MSYQIRQSQVVHTWPAGAIIDLPGLSLIMLCHDDKTEDWGIEDSQDDKLKKNILDDPRLSCAFHVKHFVIPPIFDGRNTLGIYSLRFPRVHYCPKCGKIYFLEKQKGEELYPSGTSSYNSLMKPFICTRAGCYQPKNVSKTPQLVPMRFVIASEEGFLDDFPWDWFVHISCPRFRNQGNQLFYSQKGGSAGLSDIEIISKDQQGNEVARRNLGEIFDQEIFTKSDSGSGNYLEYMNGQLSKPWLGWKMAATGEYEYQRQTVGIIPAGSDLHSDDQLTSLARRKFPRTIQRGAGNIFFPIIYSGIRLPQECYKLTCPEVIQKSLLDSIETLISDSPENYFSFKNVDWKNYFINKIKGNSSHKLLSKGYNKDEVERYIINYFSDINNLNGQNFQIELREQEFKAFTGDYIESNDVWFKKKKVLSNNFADKFLESFIDQVVLMEKISVLKVYRGFTRIKPLMNDELIFANDPDKLPSNQLLEEYQRIQDARKDPINTKELPAIEVKGEGIFIHFNNSVLNDWSTSYPNDRLDIINNNLQNANIIFDQNQSPICKRYLLLHTLSHIILKELADDCGYGLTSLAEIIYCSSDCSIGTDNEMNGILIYTTTSDSEGSLGGLVEKGNSKYLAALIKKAVDKSKWCSSDPLCISAENGQGFLGLNLAACYSCVLLPETSCEKMNKYLDRAALIGTIDNPSIGFFQFLKCN